MRGERRDFSAAPWARHVRLHRLLLGRTGVLSRLQGRPAPSRSGLRVSSRRWREGTFLVGAWGTTRAKRRAAAVVVVVAQKRRADRTL